jgi:hypothetical protein
VVIGNFDIDWTGCAMGPLKADSQLVVDTDAVLALPIAFQCFQPVARQSGEIFQARRRVQSLFAISKALGFAIPVTDDH